MRLPSMKLEPAQLRKYTDYIDEITERQVLGKPAPVLVCQRCKFESNLVIADVGIPASPAGTGGDYNLCLDCTIETLEEANGSLAEYYGTLL